MNLEEHLRGNWALIFSADQQVMQSRNRQNCSIASSLDTFALPVQPNVLNPKTQVSRDFLRKINTAGAQVEKNQRW